MKVCELVTRKLFILLVFNRSEKAWYLYAPVSTEITGLFLYIGAADASWSRTLFVSEQSPERRHKLITEVSCPKCFIAVATFFSLQLTFYRKSLSYILVILFLISSSQLFDFSVFIPYQNIYSKLSELSPINGGYLFINRENFSPAQVRWWFGIWN